MKNHAIIFFILIGIILVISCSSSERFGVSQRYDYDKTEIERPLDQFVVEKYERIINIDTLSIPLNKFVISKTYKVYIGVSFATDANVLYSIYQKDSLFTIIQNKITIDTISVFFKKQNEFFYSLLYNSTKDKYTYVLTLESDSTLVSDKFQSNFLIHKISNAN